jgi:hypothetical protein
MMLLPKGEISLTTHMQNEAVPNRWTLEANTSLASRSDVEHLRKTSGLCHVEAQTAQLYGQHPRARGEISDEKTTCNGNKFRVLSLHALYNPPRPIR